MNYRPEFETEHLVTSLGREAGAAVRSSGKSGGPGSKSEALLLTSPAFYSVALGRCLSCKMGVLLLALPTSRDCSEGHMK